MLSCPVYLIGRVTVQKQYSIPPRVGIRQNCDRFHPESTFQGQKNAPNRAQIVAFFVKLLNLLYIPCKPPRNA